MKLNFHKTTSRFLTQFWPIQTKSHLTILHTHIITRIRVVLSKIKSHMTESHMTQSHTVFQYFITYYYDDWQCYDIILRKLIVHLMLTSPSWSEVVHILPNHFRNQKPLHIAVVNGYNLLEFTGATVHCRSSPYFFVAKATNNIHVRGECIILDGFSLLRNISNECCGLPVHAGSLRSSW